MKKGVTIFLWAMIVASRCSPGYVSEAELKQYVTGADNGLVSRVESGSTILEMIYRPKDLVKALELREVMDETEKSEILARVDTLEYFVLRLSRRGQEIESTLAGNQNLYNDAISYLSSGIGSSIYLSCGGDSLRALDTVYAGAFGGSDATSVMVVFEGKLEEKKEDVKVYFEDRLFGTGISKFVFKSKDIRSIPKIKFN